MRDLVFVAFLCALFAAGLRRPFVFVLTQAKARTRLQMQAVMALAKHGKLAPTVVHDRTDLSRFLVGSRLPG